MNSIDNQQPPAVRGATRTLRAFTWLSVLILSAGLFTYICRARLAVSSAAELDYGEGTVLWQAQNLLHLDKAVHHLGTYPYILFNYTPVFHGAALLLSQFTHDLLSAGRLVSILSMLGICLLSALLVRRATPGWAGIPCGLMAALFLLYLPNADWSLLMRVDTIGLFFTYLGLFFFVRSSDRPDLAYAAFGCFTLAVYSKQTLIAAPAACLLILFAEERKRAFQVLAAFALAGLTILGIAQFLTGGEMAWHLFTYNVSPWNWRHGLWLAWDQCWRSGVMVLLALAQVARMIRFKLWLPQGGRTSLVFAVYLAIASVTSLSITKVGANVNYVLEPLFACCVLAALFVAGYLMALPTGALPSVPARIAALTALGLLLFSNLHQPDGSIPFRQAVAAREQAQVPMLKRLRSLPGEVYSEEMTLLVEAGKQVPGEPSSVTFLAAMHLWNEQPLVERFRSRFFSGLIVNTSLDNLDHFSPAVQEAVKSQYEPKERIGFYTLYLPRNAAQFPQSQPN